MNLQPSIIIDRRMRNIGPADTPSRPLTNQERYAQFRARCPYHAVNNHPWKHLKKEAP